jgi:hypothetical protein
MWVRISLEEKEEQWTTTFLLLKTLAFKTRGIGFFSFSAALPLEDPRGSD